MASDTYIGGTHTHHHYSQQELALESKVPFSARIEPTIIEILKERAEKRGTTPSKHAGDIIKQYLDLEPHLSTLQAILEKIVT